MKWVACLQCVLLMSMLQIPAVLAQAEGASALEEVVVSATRIPTEWSRLPAAVAWVDQDEIQQGRQQLGLDESLVNIPGVFSQNRYNFAQDLRVSIRGFGARANFGIRGIMLIADDIPLTMPDGQGNVDSIDLGSATSVEVLRGPASAVYGASSGGVITIRTEDGPDIPFLSGRISAGAYDYFLAQMKAGGQAGDLNWIVNASDTRLDGYREQSRYERTLWNSKFRYDFADSSSLTVVFNAVDSPRAQDPGALTAAEAEADPRQAAPRNLQFDADEAVQQQSLGMAWRKPVNERNELFLRGYVIQRDFQNLLPFDINSNGQGGSVDLDRSVGGVAGHWSWDQALGGSRQNRLVLGFDLAEQRDLRERFANNEGVPGILTTRQDEDVSSASLLLEDAWDISQQLLLTLGARFDDMEYSVNDRTSAGGSGQTAFQEFSPMAALSWSHSPGLNLYGNISTSFDPPAIAELVNPDGPTGFNQALSPQTATNYEIGFKGVQGGRLRYELALFHIDVTDEIVPFELDGAGQAFFRNAGRSTHDGVEAGMNLELVPGLSSRLAYTWSDFSFKRFSEPNGTVYDGNRIPGVPQHQFHLDLAWRQASGFYAGVDFLYVGTFFANNANTVETEAYFVSNVRLGFRRSSGDWTFEPFIGVNNLLDEAFMDNIRINATFGRYYEPAPERNVYAGMELRLDL
ncbi:MAG TPA: TonB-dependent receptor [Xanthomonadales bacterium]|nr:TonB-dependent receptor [Xanthomonadales bacterium]